MEDRVQCCVERHGLELRETLPKDSTVATILKTNPASLENKWPSIQSDYIRIPPVVQNKAPLTGLYPDITYVKDIDVQPQEMPANLPKKNGCGL